MHIQPAQRDDDEAVWRILEPMIRAGETFTLPRGMNRDDALAYWFAADHEVFIARDGSDGDAAIGTYWLTPNHKGGGAHVANCAYVAASSAAGRGVGRAMCEHSIDRARSRGFLAMQFNFVVSTNVKAVHLW